MVTRAALQAEDKDFFRDVFELAFRNPFEPESLELEYRIAGGKYPVGEELSTRLFAAVRKRLDKATANGTLNWQHFSGEDRDMIRLGLLHDAYYTCFAKFDDLILRQIDKDSADQPIPFAKETLSLLRNRGFSVEDSLRYFSFYYQLRRAWYFINHGLIGGSASMERMRSHLWRSVFTSFPHLYETVLWNRMEDFSTFLVGETGTGKGTAAAAIGRSGYIPFDEKKNCFVESFTHNFIEINLSQFPESLIESELFGHRKGAFTGAVDSHRGVFALCSRYGSIFLDEIGDVTVPVQIKLLKVLEERNFAPVGSHEKVHFSGRIIAATNKPIKTLRASDSFREDFYYRLCSNVIRVPSLRQQLQEDPATLEVLLRHTVGRILGQPSPELARIVQEIIDKTIGPAYHWPGNVRELEQAIRCVLLNHDHCGEIEGWCEVPSDPLATSLNGIEVSAKLLLSGYCRALYEKHLTYEKVAQITGLDPRTVKKHIHEASL
ncbi:MAG: sigma-54-dependent transcriptional regulator [Desulforhopalus sp.]